MQDLDAAETLFIVSSKTFTTLETMTNAHTARTWALKTLGNEKAIAKHFVAVSTNAKEVGKFASTRPICSASGTGRRPRFDGLRHRAFRPCWPSGPDHFRAMLAGFHEMDEHFRTAPFEKNLPVLMGLLGRLVRRLLRRQTVAVLPYEQYLKRFPAYLQQLTMESNGKHVTLEGTEVDYQTGAGLLGRTGHQRAALVLPAHSIKGQS